MDRGGKLPPQSNYSICYEAILRVYRNAIVDFARGVLRDKHGELGDLVKTIYEDKWQGMERDAKRDMNFSFGGPPTDDLDVLDVNHFGTLFAAFFDDLWPEAHVRDRDLVLGKQREVAKLRNSIAHPRREELAYKDALLGLMQAELILRDIDSDAAREIRDLIPMLHDGSTPVLARPQAASASPAQHDTLERPALPREYSKRRQMYHDFFVDFLNLLKAQSPGFTTASRVAYDNWLTIGAGRTGFYFQPEFMRQPDRFVVQLNISTGDRQKNKYAYDQLLANRDEIESAMGAPLEWRRLDEKKECRIGVTFTVGVNPSSDSLDGIKNQAVNCLVRLNEILRPRIQALDLEFPLAGGGLGGPNA